MNPFSRRRLLQGMAAGGVLATGAGLRWAAEPALPAAQPAHAAPGRLREYWIQADSFLHNLMPTGLDGMMGMRYRAEQTSYWALGYRAFTPGWGRPLPGGDDLGPNTGIPLSPAIAARRACSATRSGRPVST